METEKPIATVVIPYVPNTSEAIRRVLKGFNIRTAFQATNTLKRNLVHPKDPIDPNNRTDLVYKIPCEDCQIVYIGQTSRQLQVRKKEHQRCTNIKINNQQRLRQLERDSAIALHSIAEGHNINFCSNLNHSGRLPHIQRTSIRRSCAY